jgi:DNA-binding sugar fermentation-stimulating protein
MTYKSGIYLEEGKHRFSCTVLLDGKKEQCFVSSSSKLLPLINLKEKEVLLTETKSKKAKVKHTLFAVKDKKGYILLDLNYVNKLLFEKISISKKYKNKNWTFKRERRVNNRVKTDLTVENGEKQIIYEAKTIISNKEEAIFPSIKGERSLWQLKEFKLLLKKGIEVNYCLFLLTTEIKSVVLNKENKAFAKAFKVCLKAGIQIQIYRVCWKKDNFVIVRKNKLEKLLL